MKTQGAFFLAGMDFESESREMWADTFERALAVALECSAPDESGPAWLHWEIWGNHPVTWEWMPFACSVALPLRSERINLRATERGQS